jgi:hypothetical protein
MHNKWKTILTFLVLAVLLNRAIIFPAFAQETISDLQITEIDVSDFPNIKILVQAIDAKNEPKTDLTSQSLSVTENGESVEFTMNPDKAGIQVIFLIDAGIKLDSYGATGDTRIGEIRSVIRNFLAQMNASDSVMILAQEGKDTIVISDFSSSVTDLQNNLESYQYNSEQASSGYAGIVDALLRLDRQTTGKEKFIVFLSSGIQTIEFNNYNSIVRRLSETDPPTIHALLFRAGDDKFGSRLLELSKLGRGSYSLYRSEEVTNSLYQLMGIWRNQYLITYRSPSSTTGNREVVISTMINNITASNTYNITLQPPQVTIQDPVANSTVIRKPGTATLGKNDTGFETDIAPLKVKIDWPDNHPRELTNISVVVDNQTQGAIANPSLDNSGIVQVPWDLRTYNQIGQNPVSIQVQVTDELGMTSTSASIPLIVMIQPDACKGLTGFLCSAVIFIAPYANFLAVGISLAALALVIIFRRQIATVGTSIVEGGIAIITRVTKRRTASSPKAYLQVLAGIDSGRTTFDLFGTTPIGRSRRHAELIFHATDEDSPVSRLHCTILDDDSVFSIRDEDSQWGTYLNNKKLEALTPEELHEGDEIELGQVERGGIRLRFSLADPNDNGSSDSDREEIPIDEDGRITKPRRK